MSQNESTPFLVTDAKNLTLIDATRENSPWWKQEKKSSYFYSELECWMSNPTLKIITGICAAHCVV